MSQQETKPEDVIPFMSFTSLRDTHRELLKKKRQVQKDGKDGSKKQESEALWQAVEEFLRRGEAAGAYMDVEEDRVTAQNLLDYWHNQLFHAGREGPEAILADFDPLTQPEIPDRLCPYVGLHAFDSSNEHLFYGRSQLISELLGQALVSRLVAAVGPSGSGKSSVVLAGLLPRLKDGELPGSDHWHYYDPFVPGSAPLTSLARLLQPEGVEAAEWIPEHIEKLRQDPDHLTRLIESQIDVPAILTIDQFEEAFTLCHDEEERDAFLNNLLNLIRTRESRHLVILTMRVDYESYLHKAPLFHSLFEQGQIRVTAMNAGELREAIEKPAEAAGLKFEEGLIDALVREIVGEPAALPLLQFTLLQLWDNRERNRVTWETYRRLGGVMQALAHTADNIYDNLLPEEKVTAKRILLRLVRPSEGLEFTRSRVRRQALYQTGEANDRIDRVLDKLIQSRLVHSTKGLTPNDDQIEVAHEALVRNWPRLVEWLEEERLRLRHRLRLTTQAEEWDARGRNDDTLLRGALLHEALQHDDLNPIETEFVQASEAALHREQEAKEAIRQRELEQARALAREQELAARRARNFNVALIIILVLAVGGLLSFFSYRDLQAQAEATESEATQAALVAQVTADAAARLALTSTTEAGMAEQANSLATSEVATNQALRAEQSDTQSRATATAQFATATAQKATAEAIVTEAARATAAAQGAETPSSASQPTATPNAEQLQLEAQLNAEIRAEDNMPMLYITGGMFEMGSDSVTAESDESPVHTVQIDSFYLDTYEVSVQQYADFLNRLGANQGACGGFNCAETLFSTTFTNLLNNLGVFAARPGSERFPATWISWHGANAYCQSIDARLPTEAEWEYAARGRDDRIYPWGDATPTQNLQAVFGYTNNYASVFGRVFQPLDALSAGVSPFGIYSMAGGVWEWVQDNYEEDYYQNPAGDGSANEVTGSDLRVLRGGSWTDPVTELRAANRYALPAAIENPNDLLYLGVGFRCARDAEQ